jgi:cyclic pyranopterin phosphate synthase
VISLRTSADPTGPRLLDSQGRHLQYLRLSITELCNFRCTYCLPGGCPKGAVAQPLTVPEIDRLVRGFAAMGFWRVRLTGGEPTLRRDILEIVARVAAAPGVRHVGLTTNGYRLRTLASDLAEAGLNCLNVSVDSLDPARFASITGGTSRLEDVVGGIEAAMAAGIPRIKVNAVLLAGTDGAALDRFLGWVRDAPLSIRFIELMETRGDPAYFARNHVPASVMERLLEERGWSRLPGVEGEGPASEYGHPGHRGRIGIIAPYRKGFCATCNRLRVSASGNLKLCLFADREVPLRHLLRSDGQRDALAAAVRTAVGAKPASHHLGEGRVGMVRSLASIGG